MKNRNHINRTAAIMCTVFVSFLAMRAFGQAPPPAPPKDQTPPQNSALRVTTRSIQVSVIALDKDGHPVTGLSKDDFTLTDRGQEEKITYFAEETTRAEPATASVSGANKFSNRLEQKAGSPTSATVILLDLRNTSFNDMAYAKKQIAKFLSQIQPQDRVALYSLSSEIYIMHDFTQNAGELVRALADSKDSYDFRLGASEIAPSKTGDENVDLTNDASTMRATEFDTTNRFEQTALAIKTIADHLKGLPGRKNLIWVSSSFPIEILTSGGPTPQAVAATRSLGTSGNLTYAGPRPAQITDIKQYTEQIEDAARSLNSADVAVYPVDARGLIGNAQTAMTSGTVTNFMTTPPDTTSPFPDRANFDTMATFADHTGGLAFYNSNDIQGAVRKAIDDSRVTYVIGYYPTNTKWDGKFREIKIRTNKPGVRLRYRLGYYALPDTTLSDTEKAQLLKDAEWSPLEATDLGIEVTVNPAETSEGRAVHAQLRIASNQLHFDLNQNNWKDSLDVVWVEIGATGRAIGAFQKTVGLDVPQESYDLLVSKGISFDQTLKPSANAVELRLVVRDGGSGAIGSVNIPLGQIFGKTKTPPIVQPKN
jgi:VWFA-related protein